jgi:hypothetical protein
VPKAAHQAKRLHDELDVWVTAVICLDRRDHPPAKRGRVWVMSKDYACDWIAAQRNTAISFDRLARWADSL